MKRCAVWWDWKGRRKTWQIKIWQILFSPITITTFDYCAYVYIPTERPSRTLYLWAADLRRGGPEKEDDWWLCDKKGKGRKKETNHINIYFKARKDDVKNVFFSPQISSSLFTAQRCGVRVCVYVVLCGRWWWVPGVLLRLGKDKEEKLFIVPFCSSSFFLMPPRFISWIFFPIYVVPLLLIFPSRTLSLRSHALALFEKRRVSASRHRAVWRYTYHIPCSDSILELLLLFSF